MSNTTRKPRGVVDAVTISTAKPGKSKIKLTLVRPNGHRTEIATTQSLTEEMIADAEALISFLTTGRRPDRVGEKGDDAIVIRDGRVAAGGG